jgi:hypothetical protein
MCERPINHDGKTFACRSCDACIATRRAQWEARAMMEKHLHPYMLALGMTYDMTTQANRDARQMFQYADFKAFMDRLRRAARYRRQRLPKAQRAAVPVPYIRFILAGEQGDRTDHCHWHAILYSNVDLTALGEVKRLINGRRQVETDRAKMMTVGKRKVRLNWSMWPHGFVTFQEPDFGGVHYVLSYCIMDQFTVQKSKDTMREAKASNFATGLFRMSKFPPIGEAWLWNKWVEHEQRGTVPTSLNFKIPGMRSFYHPSGSFREKILYSLVALNQRIVWATGANAPQWSTLLASCADNESDMEILEHGQTLEADPETPEAELAKKQRAHAGEHARREFARACGNALPCESCLSALPDETLDALGVRREVEFRAIFYRSKDGFRPVEERQRTFLGRSNPYCQKRGSKVSSLTFPNTDQTRHALKGRGDV